MGNSAAQRVSAYHPCREIRVLRPSDYPAFKRPRTRQLILSQLRKDFHAAPALSPSSSHIPTELLSLIAGMAEELEGNSELFPHYSDFQQPLWRLRFDRVRSSDFHVQLQFVQAPTFESALRWASEHVSELATDLSPFELSALHSKLVQTVTTLSSQPLAADGSSAFHPVNYASLVADVPWSVPGAGPSGALVKLELQEHSEFVIWEAEPLMNQKQGHRATQHVYMLSSQPLSWRAIGVPRFIRFIRARSEFHAWRWVLREAAMRSTHLAFIDVEEVARNFNRDSVLQLR